MRKCDVMSQCLPSGNQHITTMDNAKDAQTPAGWDRQGEALAKTILFKDFSEAFAFLTRVAMLAEQQCHHPEIHNVYQTVTLRLSTHDAGNTVTEKDINLARAINRLLA